MSTQQSLVVRSFVAGEVAPDLGARADLTQYASGAAVIRNFVVGRGGGLARRPGFQHITEVKDSTVAPKFLKFVFEANDQSYLLEFGNGYVRFYWHRARVMSGGVPYEIASPYGADVGSLWADQSTDTLVLTHPNYPIYELRRLGHTSWAFALVSFAPTISAPTGLIGTIAAAGAATYRYQVTAAKKETFEESIASATAIVALTTPPSEEHPVILNWTAVAAAEEYYVYCDPFNNGVYGFVGTAKTNRFYDPGVAPDFSITPPILKAVFDAAGKYPAKSCHFQQRQCYANSNIDH
jgi:hypothetical protein